MRWYAHKPIGESSFLNKYGMDKKHTHLQQFPLSLTHTHTHTYSMSFSFTSIQGAIFTRSFTNFLQLCTYLPTKAPNHQQSGCDDVPSRNGMAQKVSQIFLWPETCLFFTKIWFTLQKACFPFQMFRLFLMILESLNWPWVYYPSSPRLLLLHLTPVGPPPNTGQAFKLLVWKSVLKKLGFQINVWGRFLDIISQDPGASKSNSMVTCLHLSIWP